MSEKENERKNVQQILTKINKETGKRRTKKELSNKGKKEELKKIRI